MNTNNTFVASKLLTNIIRKCGGTTTDKLSIAKKLVGQLNSHFPVYDEKFGIGTKYTILNGNVMIQ